jgi:hypothetical protein
VVWDGDVIRGLVVDYEREKGALSHPQKPTDAHQTSKVFDDHDHGRDSPKTEHHNRQDSIRTIFLPQNSEERGGQNVWNEEDTEDNVVLIPDEVEGVFQTVGFGVPQIGFVKAVEQVHDSQDWEDARVKFPNQLPFRRMVDKKRSSFGDVRLLLAGFVVVFEIRSVGNEWFPFNKRWWLGHFVDGILISVVWTGKPGTGIPLFCSYLGLLIDVGVTWLGRVEIGGFTTLSIRGARPHKSLIKRCDFPSAPKIFAMRLELSGATTDDTQD